MRSEKNTKPFLRTSEFLWQEGHTIHSISNEAKEFSIKMWKIYEEFINHKLLIATIKGEKTKLERFAGAENTYTIETIMKDGQALQTATSHYLAQKFSKLFDIKFLDKNQKKQYIFQTSWGMSSRIIGAIIMSHGDDRGLVLPPEIAPYEIIILELSSDRNPEIKDLSKKLFNLLSKNYRVHIDSEQKGLGYKSQKWEARGIPIRIELGKKEFDENTVIIANRFNGEKKEVKIEKLSLEIENELAKYKKNLMVSSRKNLDEKIKSIKDKKEIKNTLENKNVIKAYISWSEELEREIKTNFGATIRCILTESVKEKRCIFSNKVANMEVIIARAY